ncbi:MAG TPA: hypothetical protein GX405_18065 [Rhizobiales bacterium]|nr:hypothetical protein [Hyphomicrobiales bacterium]
MVSRMSTRRIRSLLAMLLALSIGAGGTLADALHVAAMSGRAADRIVICAADGGASTILVDSAGNPVDPEKQSPAARCDDCLPTQVNAIPVSIFALAVGLRVGSPASQSPLRPTEMSRISSNAARAPPTREIAT